MVVVRIVLLLRTPTIAVMVVDGGTIGVNLSSLMTSSTHFNSIKRFIKTNTEWVRKIEGFFFYHRDRVGRNCECGNREGFRKIVDYVHGW